MNPLSLKKVAVSLIDLLLEPVDHRVLPEPKDPLQNPVHLIQAQKEVADGLPLAGPDLEELGSGLLLDDRSDEDEVAELDRAVDLVEEAVEDPAVLEFLFVEEAAVDNGGDHDFDDFFWFFGEALREKFVEEFGDVELFWVAVELVAWGEEVEVDSGVGLLDDLRNAISRIFRN